MLHFTNNFYHIVLILRVYLGLRLTWEVSVSLYHGDFREQTGVVRFSDRHLYLMSLLTDPEYLFPLLTRFYCVSLSCPGTWPFCLSRLSSGIKLKLRLDVVKLCSSVVRVFVALQEHSTLITHVGAAHNVISWGWNSGMINKPLYTHARTRTSVPLCNILAVCV